MISAAQIRAGRALINAKQSELAKAAGVALATLNNIERGVGDPRSSTLDAIERALSFAGVECESDGQRETVSLQRLSRPSAHDTYFACQRVLECLEPGSLLKVERIRFYVHSASSAPGSDGGSRKLAVLIDGEARTLLFDQANFTLADSVRVAEVARMISAAMINCPDCVEYSESVVEDTTVAHLEEAIYRLSGLSWQPLRHPKDLLTVIGEWTSALDRLADTREHPLFEAFAAATGRESSFKPEVSFPHASSVQEPVAQSETETPPTETETVALPEEPTPEASSAPDEPQVVTRQTLSAEDVAKLLGEQAETAPPDDEDASDEGPPLPDLSPPVEESVTEEGADYGDPPPLPDPSAPAETAAPPVEEAEAVPPPLPDPSSPAQEPDPFSAEVDESDDPLLTTPPPSFRT